MKIGTYIYYRIIGLLFQFFGGMAMIFVVVRTLPYTPEAITRFGLASSGVTQEEIDQIIRNLRAQWGIDQPIHIQFWKFLLGLLETGSLGESWYGGSVNEIIGDKIIFSIILTLTSLFFIVLFSMLIGIFVARRNQSITDFNIKFFSSIIYGIPYYIFGVLIIFYLEVQEVELTASEAFWTFSTSIVLILAIVFTTYQYRLIRKEFLDVLAKPYMVTARAKGLNDRTIIFKHAMRNTLPSIIISFSLLFPLLFSSVLVLEKLFGMTNGAGTLLFNLVEYVDWGILIGLSALFLILINLTNFITDISVKFVNPFEGK